MFSTFSQSLDNETLILWFSVSLSKTCGSDCLLLRPCFRVSHTGSSVLEHHFGILILEPLQLGLQSLIYSFLCGIFDLLKG